MLRTAEDAETAMLEPLGLSEAESEVYRGLLDREDATPAELTGAAPGRSTDEIGATLAALGRRGLVTRSATAPPAYRLVDPGVALAGVVAEREHALHTTEQVVQQLAQHYRLGRSETELKDQIEFVEGPDAAGLRVVDLYRHARAEVRAMERPPYREPNREPNPIELDLLERGVAHRVLYAQSAIDLPGRLTDLVGGIAAGETARVAPTLPARLILVDDTYALLPARTGGLITDGLLVVHRGALLDVLSEMFETTWNHAIPLRLRPDGVEVETADDGDQVILDLLAAGLTEQAIARQVDISQRTVQRRIREISERLGARTRFQAGLQAARRGRL